MPEPDVTDHAVLRYLQRRDGIDVEAIRRRIARSCRRGVELGASGVQAEGMTYRLIGAAVVSCWRTNEPCIRTGRAEGRRQMLDD